MFDLLTMFLLYIIEYKTLTSIDAFLKTKFKIKKHYVKELFNHCI